MDTVGWELGGGLLGMGWDDSKLEEEAQLRTHKGLATWLRSEDFIFQMIRVPLNNSKL